MNQLDYIEFLVFFGIALLAASILYKRLETSSFSLPVVLVLLGILIGWIFPKFEGISPIDEKIFTEHLTELAVIISLVGAGLKIDRDIGLKSWRITWRLLLIAMPLSIFFLLLGSYFWMGMSIASSLLLGAVMAPTDPVLASSVQVGPPGEGNEDNVRFGLTSEAGFNDGLAFPFVHLSILLASSTSSMDISFEWLSYYFIWKIFGAIIFGIIVGKLIAYLTFRFIKRGVISDGLVVIALTLLSYGIAELCSTYGFISVFVAAYFFRRFEKEHEHHEELHNFSEQFERILMSALLLFFGILVAQGFLNYVPTIGIVLAFVFIFLIRPISAYLSLSGLRIKKQKKWAISFLGIRGIGSFYYLAYAFTHSEYFMENEMQLLWSTAGFIVLLSIFVHGISAPIIMRKI